MANRKFLIESILGLAQKIGANPNKYMGTKQNINFLGTGDRGMKGTTFSGELNDDFLNLGFTKDDMIRIIEQDSGYVTAGKLNDAQLNTMFNNLKMIDETFSPPPGPANIIDLETGTRGINKEGLESLRETDKIQRFTKGLRTSKTAMSDKIKEGIEGLKTKIKAPFNIRGAVDDIERVEKKAAEENFLRTGAANFEDGIEAEGARRAVLRQVLAKEPDFFMLPPETAESISKFRDLQKGGANAPDPLVVFRNVGNFTDKELKQIDFIIDQKLFEDTSIIADDVLEYIRTIRPEGLRPGFRSGRSVKGIAELLKLTNKKFGKDTLKVADDVEPSEFAKFNERNRKLTDEEYDDLVEEYGEGVPFDIETVADAEKYVASQKAYEASMLADYKAGRLDPKPGEPNRKRFLEKKAEEAQGSGDRRLFTIDEAEELEALQQGEQYGSIKNAKIPVELITADILKAKYPGISDELAELIGNDTNLQRKAEALASIEQAMALQGAGKSADETIAILKGEPETKMSKGGLARILEM
jgi:hypothetical protein